MRKRYKKLTYADRQVIEAMVRQKATVKDIAEATETHVTTIYRELQRGTDEKGIYNADRGQKALFEGV